MKFSEFFTSRDKIQLYVKTDNLPKNVYDEIVRNLDIGDIIGTIGSVFITKTKELSIKSSDLSILSKNIRHLPNLKEKDGEAFFSFEDKELRYRNRHLDLITNPSVKSVFESRAKIVKIIRNSKNGSQIFIEASGGITKKNLNAYLNTGVNAISIGAMTHGVKSKDIRLEFI